MTAEPAALRSEILPDLALLGAEWDPLFDAGPGVQSRRAWFAATQAAALPPGTTAAFVAITGAHGPAALVPMAAGPGRRWASLTTPYTCLFQPLLRPGAEGPLLRACGAAFGRVCRRWPVTTLEAMDADWPGLPAFRAGMRGAGLRTRVFTHFANWHEPVAPCSWQRYAQARPGELRETIRRKTKLVARDPAMRLELAREAGALSAALDAYEAVYARSWKEPEPFPRFNRVLVDALAQSGWLRIGVMWAGDTPIAAQYWTVADRVATVLKLAHDDAYRPLSPGTVLTGFVIRHLIEAEGITSLDFGRGDDPYKRAWAGERRMRIGVVAANPLMSAGLYALVRHDAGRVIRKLRDALHPVARHPDVAGRAVPPVSVLPQRAVPGALDPPPWDPHIA